jgi:hypothetical protein
VVFSTLDIGVILHQATHKTVLQSTDISDIHDVVIGAHRLEGSFAKNMNNIAIG